MLVGGEQLGLSHSEGTSARQDFGLPSVTSSGLCHDVVSELMARP